MAAAGLERRQPQRRGAFANNDQAQKIMALVLRHMVGIQRTLGESPTRFKPLLYLPEEKARGGNDRMPPEGAAWCEGYMAGVKLRDDEWQGAVRCRRCARLDLPDRSARVRRSRRRLHRVGRQRREARRADRRAAGRSRADLSLLQEKRNAKRVIGPGSRRGAVEIARKTRQRPALIAGRRNGAPDRKPHI
jgi:hypothetical protein